MKLATSNSEVYKRGNTDETEFTIKASAKAFRVLADGLYNNKPLAIVRELSCNALDSHKAAGKVDVPFRVSLPDILNPQFSVQDFGVGLSDDEVKNVYCTFFMSTKDDSNDYIGALGLGSKSPFSYTDAFNITSIHGGIKRDYTAFISEAGTPTITKMYEVETDECNGVTVSIPINEKDFGDFRNSAITVFDVFDIKPDIYTSNKKENFEYKSVENVHGFSVVKCDYQKNNRIFAVQGSIEYDITDDVSRFSGLDSFKVIYQSIFSAKRYHCCIRINFPIGSLDVTASRESISFDERTKQSCINVINDLVDGAVNPIKAQYDAIEDPFEKFSMAHRSIKDGDYNIDPIVSLVEMLPHTSIRNFSDMHKKIFSSRCATLKFYTPHGENKKLTAHLSNFSKKFIIRPSDFVQPSTTVMYVDDSHKSNIDGIISHAKDLVGDITSNHSFVVIRPSFEKKENSKEWVMREESTNEIIEISDYFYTSSYFVFGSTIKRPTIKKEKSPRSKSCFVRLYDNKNYYFERQDPDDAIDIDYITETEELTLYVPLHSGSVDCSEFREKFNVTYGCSNRILSAISRVLGCNLIGVSRNKLKAYEESQYCLNAFDEIYKFYSTYTVNEKDISIDAYSKLSSNLALSDIKEVVDCFDIKMTSEDAKTVYGVLEYHKKPYYVSHEYELYSLLQETQGIENIEVQKDIGLKLLAINHVDSVLDSFKLKDLYDVYDRLYDTDQKKAVKFAANEVINKYLMDGI